MSTYRQIHHKLLFRIDFQPTLKYIDQMYKAASMLEGEYENWKTAQSSSFAMLFDRDSQRQLTIDGQSISFVTSNEAILKDPYSEISKILVLFLSQGDIPKIRRIGIRSMSLHTVNRSYDEFVDKFFSVFYGAQTELKAITSDKLDDVLLVLQGIKDGFQTRNQVGPLKASEIERTYGIDEYETSDDFKLNDKVAVMFDTDIISATISDFDEALLSIKDMLSLCETIHEDMMKLVEAKI